MSQLQTEINLPTVESIDGFATEGSVTNIISSMENELNSFGYELLNAKKYNEALQIFILNTKLYPKGFNTFDSLGECLLLLGNKDEGIKAYKKSLELNPQNENAKKIINGEK